jgi:hypothetical protein
VGHCYEFAVSIDASCDHAMRVSDDGGACVCPTCGAHCEGRFAACAGILEEPGYVPLTAPAWAVELVDRPTDLRPREATAHAPTPVDGPDHSPPVDDALVAAIDRAVRDAVADVGSTLRSQLLGELLSASDDLRQDALGAVDQVRRELADRHKELRDQLDRLSLDQETDRETTRAVVEGLDRVARRLARRTTQRETRA